MLNTFFPNLYSMDQLLWILAILTFGVGDIVTTVVFISAEMNHEGNPLVASVIESVGLWVLLPWKLAVFALFAALYRLSPDSISVGVPLGLFAFGTVLTVWNIYSSVFGVRIVV